MERQRRSSVPRICVLTVSGRPAPTLGGAPRSEPARDPAVVANERPGNPEAGRVRPARGIYTQAIRILITADSGGSDGCRLRLWKLELRKFADQTGLTVWVCHFPPGTSKWNKVKHRLFSVISSNWRWKPLRDYETIVHLIARTTTSRGLKVTCRLDRRKYSIGRRVRAAEMQQVQLQPNKFHGEWNYTITPRVAG